MSTASMTPSLPSDAISAEPITSADVDERFVIERVAWDQYVKMNDAFVKRSNPRVIYCDGRLTLVAKSRPHYWLADVLGTIVSFVAASLGIECEPSGETTFRKELADAGLEGDRTFHFGATAIHMRGPKNVDLSVDPPPDLAIEVEVTHSAELAMAAWSRLGVPEVWRFNAKSWVCTIWNRDEAGVYRNVERSQFLPMITPAEIAEQCRAAQQMGGTAWVTSVGAWVEDVIKPRAAKV